MDPTDDDWDLYLEVRLTEYGPRTWSGWSRVNEPENPDRLAALTGAVYAMAYDPVKPDRLYPTQNPRALALRRQLTVDLGVTAPQDERIRAEGEATHAIVRALEPTGLTRHGWVEYRLRVELVEILDASGNAPELTRSVFLLPPEVPEHAVGQVIHVRYLSTVSTGAFALTTTNA